MKITKIIASVLLVSVLCCACADSGNPSGKNNRDKKKTDPSETKIVLPENEILVVSGHHNAWESYYNERTFIMSDGSVYYSREYQGGNSLNYDKTLTDEQRAELLRNYTKPVATMKMEDVKELYANMQKIDPDADFVYEEITVEDAGTGFTNVIVNGKAIKIRQSGERTGVLDDPYADTVNEIVNEFFLTIKFDEDISVYSNTESIICTLECPAPMVRDTKRIIKSMDELEALENDTGLDLKNKAGFENFKDKDSDGFKYSCIIVQIFQYPSIGVTPETDAFIVSGDYVGFASLKDYSLPPVDGDADYSAKTYCHIVILSNYYMDRYEPFLK